jgi:integrase
MNQNLNDLFKLYLRDLKRRKCKTINKIQQTYDNNIAPSLGDKLITDIIRGDIASLHFDISERAPYIANKCLTVLKSMFNLAITLSLVDNNPATHIGKNRENKRKRYLTNDELLKIVGEMNHLQTKPQYQKAIAFLWLLILTGARKGEIANAKWSNLIGNQLVLQEHKSDKLGEDRIIYLAPQAMKIVESLPRDNDYIIGIKTPRRTWETILKNTGITNVRLHDIRHSYASWSLQVVKLSEVGDLLGHRDQATTQRYAHIHQEQSIANANKVGSHIENLITSSTRNLYQKQSG